MLQFRVLQCTGYDPALSLADLNNNDTNSNNCNNNYVYDNDDNDVYRCRTLL